MGEPPDTSLIDWRELPPAQRRVWWEQLWLAVIALSERYRLALRAGWWQDSVQVEALAAFCAWLRLYDTGAYVDPPGKLQLLWELDRLRAVTRGGEHAFDPVHDRPAFDGHVVDLGCQPSGGRGVAANGQTLARLAQLSGELAAIVERTAELTEREQIIQADLESRRGRDHEPTQAQRELTELRRTIAQLHRRAGELRCQLDDTDQI